MKCGHSANAYRVLKDGTRVHSCIICMCTDVANEQTDLTGRMAKCAYYGNPVGRNNETHYPNLMKGKCCGSIVPSSPNLPFFKSEPTKEYDEFYCGCYGWD